MKPWRVPYFGISVAFPATGLFPGRGSTLSSRHRLFRAESRTFLEVVGN